MEELLIVWLPKQKIVFTGDIFGRFPDGKIPPANETTEQFVSAIERLGLPVEKIVDVHGFPGGPHTIADVRQAMELARKAVQ